MVVAWILGMFISNTATTAMMLPIVEQILKELGEDDAEEEVAQLEFEEASLADKVDIHSNGKAHEYVNSAAIDNEGFEMERLPESEMERHVGKKPAHNKWILEDGTDLSNLPDIPMTPKSFKIIAKSLSIGVPYASNIGGLATLTGNTSNLILSGIFSESFPEAPPITYTSWLLYNLPASCIFIVMSYFWIMILFIGLDWEDIKRAWNFELSRQEAKAGAFVKNEFIKLGSWRQSEIEVGIVFAITILLWFFEDPGFMPGWAEFFRPNFVSNSQPAVLMGVILFVLPEESPFKVFDMTQDEIDEAINKGPQVDSKTGEVSDGNPWGCVTAILDWHFVEKHVPWGVVFLMGGGFSLGFWGV